MKAGDWICSRKNPAYGGIIQSIKGHYVTAHCSDGTLRTFSRKFIRIGKPEPQKPKSSIPGDHKSAFQWFVDSWSRTRSHDLWVPGGSLDQFKGFCDFFKWLSSHHPATIL